MKIGLLPGASAVLCAALLATALTGLQVKRSIEDDAVRHFAFICDQITLKIEERLGAAALASWVYSPERMRYLMDGVLRDWERHDGRSVELHVYRGSGAVPAELLFDSAGPATAIRNTLFHQRRTLAFGGGEWLLEFDHFATAAAVGYGAAWAALAGGLALSGLLFGLVLALARARASPAGFREASRRARQLAEAMRGREAQLQKLSQAVEQSPESIVITDLEGRIEYVNAAFTAVSGYGRDEVIGENPRILNSGKTPGASYAAMWQALAQGEPWRGEFCNRRRDGGEYVEFAIVTPMRQADGRITHYVATKEDITEKKRIGAELDQHRHHLEELVARRTAELEIERERTERAGRAKSEFLANMSHEIRTPINAVVGFAHLCLKLELPARGRDYVSKIGVAAQSLLAIVNDVLDLSKIDAGKLELESVVFSLDEVLEKVAGLFSLKANEKGVELVIAALPGIPERLLGDPLRLGQVLVNLVGNALKFTERGEVRLLVKAEAVGAAEARLRFEVRDSGLGMTPQQRASLFTAFGQADSSITRKYGGSGLGLAISKQLVERMQGELSVQSEAGAGSCFSFSARFGVAAAAAVPAHSALSGTRVLVVDDNADVRKLFSVNMKTFGCRVEAVASGELALAGLDAGDDYDLIVMD
ncbi:MAG: ATP-binding protein [Proteobacteria bacterium]|nr:ATP-binding protein [Pseudomonadota bacterium]